MTKKKQPCSLQFDGISLKYRHCLGNNSRNVSNPFVFIAIYEQAILIKVVNVASNTCYTFSHVTKTRFQLVLQAIPRV